MSNPSGHNTSVNYICYIHLLPLTRHREILTGKHFRPRVLKSNTDPRRCEKICQFVVEKRPIDVARVIVQGRLRPTLPER